MYLNMQQCQKSLPVTCLISGMDANVDRHKELEKQHVNVHQLRKLHGKSHKVVAKLRIPYVAFWHHASHRCSLDSFLYSQYGYKQYSRKFVVLILYHYIKKKKPWRKTVLSPLEHPERKHQHLSIFMNKFIYPALAMK